MVPEDQKEESHLFPWLISNLLQGDCEHHIIKQCAFVHVGLENIIMGYPNLVQI